MKREALMCGAASALIKFMRKGLISVISSNKSDMPTNHHLQNDAFC
jgi:hypothetical protein